MLLWQVGSMTRIVLNDVLKNTSFYKEENSIKIRISILFSDETNAK